MYDYASTRSRVSTHEFQFSRAAKDRKTKLTSSFILTSKTQKSTYLIKKCKYTCTKEVEKGAPEAVAMPKQFSNNLLMYLFETSFLHNSSQG